MKHTANELAFFFFRDCDVSDMLGTKREVSCVDLSPILLHSSRAGCMQWRHDGQLGPLAGGTEM